jgi:transcription antitermination factor NusG
VVHFGYRWPIVPEAVVEEMRATVGADQVHVIRDDLQPGETVQIAGGAFHGLRAVVTRVMPSRERAAVLLEFLGQQTSVELALESIIREGDSRQGIL